MNAKRRSPPRRQAGNGLQKTRHAHYNARGAEALLHRLDGVRATGADSWIARCPAHDDRSPSLSIKQVDDRLLLHCFAGCAPGDVLSAVGLTLADLFERPTPCGKSPLPLSQRRRHGQAADALRALRYEVAIASAAARMVRNGEALDDESLDRLAIAEYRIAKAAELAS